MFVRSKTCKRRSYYKSAVVYTYHDVFEVFLESGEKGFKQVQAFFSLLIRLFQVLILSQIKVCTWRPLELFIQLLT